MSYIYIIKPKEIHLYNQRGWIWRRLALRIKKEPRTSLYQKFELEEASWKIAYIHMVMIRTKSSYT